jgi:hypothetical protein
LCARVAMSTRPTGGRSGDAPTQVIAQGQPAAQRRAQQDRLEPSGWQARGWPHTIQVQSRKIPRGVGFGDTLREEPQVLLEHGRGDMPGRISPRHVAREPA